MPRVPIGCLPFLRYISESRPGASLQPSPGLQCKTRAPLRGYAEVIYGAGGDASNRLNRLRQGGPIKCRCAISRIRRANRAAFSGGTRRTSAPGPATWTRRRRGRCEARLSVSSLSAINYSSIILVTRTLGGEVITASVCPWSRGSILSRGRCFCTDLWLPLRSCCTQRFPCTLKGGQLGGVFLYVDACARRCVDPPRTFAYFSLSRAAMLHIRYRRGYSLAHQQPSD